MAIIMLCAIAEADIYKYEDENGIVYYTDFPLNDKAKRILKSSDSKKDVVMGSNKSSDFHQIIEDKAGKYNLDPSLIHAVIKAESNGNPYAVSRKGAMGLMQIMPSTANELGVKNPFDPEDNIDGGTKYLRYLLDKFNGDLTLALAAYNAGPKTVEKTRSVPAIPETKQYVKKVLSLYKGDNNNTSYQMNVNAIPKPTPIYKVIKEDGTILFTNSPLYKKNPRI